MQQNLSHFAVLVTFKNNFLSVFLTIILKFVKHSLFVTCCNKLFQKDRKRDHYVILCNKTVITKNLDKIQAFGEI